MTNLSPKPKYRLMLCGRGVCVERAQALQLETKLLALLAQYGLDNPESTHYHQLVNCLNVCHSGPILMVHFDGIIYRQVDEAGLQVGVKPFPAVGVIARLTHRLTAAIGSHGDIVS